MAEFDFELLRSIDALRSAASAWDDLWQRSGSQSPMARAEPLALWLDHFAPDSPLGLIVVRSGEQYFAALPLVGRGPRPLRVGGLPGNVWTPGGTLLVDPTAPAAALDRLTDGLRSLAWPLVLLDAAMPANPMWQAFSAALERAGMPTVNRPRFAIDQTELTGDWESYLASRSQNHRKQIRRALNRIGPDTRLRLLDHLTPDEAPIWLRRAFEIEDSGWKGRAGSSVLKNSSAFEFFVEQARCLAGTGELRIALLEHRGQMIAMEYGWQGKGTFFSLKIAYDENLAKLKPGRLLRTLLIERLLAERQVRQIDYLGPSSRTTHDFATGQYPLARMLVAVNALGKTLLGGYELLRPLVGKLRGPAEAKPAAKNPSEPAADHDLPLPEVEPAIA